MTLYSGCGERWSDENTFGQGATCWLKMQKFSTEFLFESGFRPNEAMGLKWPNVNLATFVLSVRHGRVLGKDKDPKTESAIRDVDITLGMLNALKSKSRILSGPQLRFS
jgi:hypothetical protein